MRKWRSEDMLDEQSLAVINVIKSQAINFFNEWIHSKSPGKTILKGTKA